MSKFGFLLFVNLVYTVYGNYRALADENAGINIVGGEEVDIKDFPYQVSILDSSGFLCGGSILSPQHVLTSADCVRYGSAYLYVRAGSSYYASGGSVHKIDWLITRQEKYYADVAVLRVVNSFVFDETRQPIPIAEQDQEPENGALATVSGWGSTLVETKSQLSKKLRAVDVSIIDRKTCSKIYDEDPRNIKIGQICAGSIVGVKDSCNGDSGGPLVVNGRQVGIVSGGWGCGRPDAPGLYANVAHFSNWIKDQVNSIQNKPEK